MDTVFIEKLSVVGKHGVGATERQVEQEFLFDIKATFDATLSTQTDVLFDTVNYVDFKTIVEETVAGGPHFLIEKIADIIATRILEDNRILDVEVTVRKPAVLSSGVPGVTIRRPA